MATLREATSEDALDIAALHVASIRKLGASAYDDHQLKAWAAGTDPDGYRIGDPVVHVLVAEADDRLVGFGSLDVESQEITAVYVHPEHAGTGVGAELLSHLESRAVAAGLTSLRLLSSLNAVPFYRNGNWEVVSRCTHTIGPNEVELPCIEMEKRLNE